MLDTLFTITFTSTVPAACAGETAVHVVDELQLTEVAFTVVAPNLIIVAPFSRANPVPVTVTVVPPPLGPVFGLTLATVGLNE